MSVLCWAGLGWARLWCAVVCCAEQCWTVLCRAVLCCTVQCCAVPCCAESPTFLCHGKHDNTLQTIQSYLYPHSVPFPPSHSLMCVIHYFEPQALQLYVEKVVVFTQANPVKDLGPECSAVLAEYAGLLASQGRLDVASTYLKGMCHVNVTILVLSCAPTYTYIMPNFFTVFIILPVSFQALIFFSST